MSHASQFDDLQFLTVAEIAEVLRVSKMSIYRMVHSGELEAVRVGRSFRVPAASVRAMLSTMGHDVPEQDAAPAGWGSC